MTDEQINCAIAEACGLSGNTYKLCLKTGNYEQSPNFCNDLNAMHEAEQHIPGDLWDAYIDNLGFVTNAFNLVQREFVCATSRQRAEAFLRTLGKWEEGK